jgi:hypothetical protein
MYFDGFLNMGYLSRYGFLTKRSILGISHQLVQDRVTSCIATGIKNKIAEMWNMKNLATILIPQRTEQVPTGAGVARELPKTASYHPLAFLSGVLLVAFSYALRVFSRPPDQAALRQGPPKLAEKGLWNLAHPPKQKVVKNSFFR